MRADVFFKSFLPEKMRVYLNRSLGWRLRRFERLRARVLHAGRTKAIDKKAPIEPVRQGLGRRAPALKAPFGVELEVL